ncbi:hypothetical protein RMSM_00875 [Rhodopirellula maiorica SM1]|uniref:Uncharacterized protein n=1 Tax=Rhodopirellula maiorica SM1 TaxID=1265738 RepID=M5RSL3_9BACT|nr:hypothetical protein RMSM_00875 [Rhodopirellula maiorica SM1]
MASTPQTTPAMAHFETAASAKINKRERGAAARQQGGQYFIIDFGQKGRSIVSEM